MHPKRSLTGYAVTMVTYHSVKVTVTGLPVAGHLSDSSKAVS